VLWPGLHRAGCRMRPDADLPTCHMLAPLCSPLCTHYSTISSTHARIGASLRASAHAITDHRAAKLERTPRKTELSQDSADGWIPSLQGRLQEYRLGAQLTHGAAYAVRAHRGTPSHVRSMCGRAPAPASAKCGNLTPKLAHHRVSRPSPSCTAPIASMTIKISYQSSSPSSSPYPSVVASLGLRPQPDVI